MTYPTIMPALTLDFQNSQQLDPRVTFSRTQTTVQATYINSAGQVAYAAEHEPRFDHDPETGECLGLLIEESRANLFDESENLEAWSSGLWTKTNSVAISPDGTQNAASLIANLGTSTQSAGRTVTQSAGIHTCSFFAKSAGLTEVKVRFSASSYQAIFELIGDGDIIQEEDGTASIHKYPNGWYKCVFTIDDPVGETAGWQIGHSNKQNIDGTTGFYIWGMQVEEGSFPTSYIPTSGTGLARSPDIAQVTGANFSSWYNQTEGSFFVSADHQGSSTFNIAQFFTVNDGTTTNEIKLFNLDTDGYLYVYTSGVSQAYFSGGTAPVGSTNRYASGVIADNYAISLNGEQVVKDTSGTQFTNMTVMNIGSSVALNSQPNGHIARLSYYNERLTDAELQTLTL